MPSFVLLYNITQEKLVKPLRDMKTVVTKDFENKSVYESRTYKYTMVKR